MTEMVRKITLSRAMRTMQDLFPEEYDFYPRSWILPEEFAIFLTEVGCFSPVDAAGKGIVSPGAWLGPDL